MVLTQAWLPHKPSHFDPATFGDPLAAEIKWSLLESQVKHRHICKLKTVSSSLYDLQTSWEMTGFRRLLGIFVLMIVYGIYAGPISDVITTKGYVFGLVGLIAWLFLSVKFAYRYLMFDFEEQTLVQRDTINKTGLHDGNITPVLNFTDVHAIQFLKKRYRDEDDHLFVGYEFNLVLKNKSRHFVCEFRNIKTLKPLIDRLTSELNIPIWDISKKQMV